MNISAMSYGSLSRAAVEALNRGAAHAGCLQIDGGEGGTGAAPLAFSDHVAMLKYARAANYIVALRAELLSLSRACGVRHPALIDPDRIEIISTGYRTTTLRQVFGYEPDWPLVSHARREAAIGLVGAATTSPAPGPQAGEARRLPRRRRSDPPTYGRPLARRKRKRSRLSRAKRLRRREKAGG